MSLFDCHLNLSAGFVQPACPHGVVVFDFRVFIFAPVQEAVRAADQDREHDIDEDQYTPQIKVTRRKYGDANP